MKKSLFPIYAYVVWCPTWSKNLGRSLNFATRPLPTRLLQLWTKDIGKFLRYFDIILTLDFQICRRIFPNKRIGGNLVYVFLCISFCALIKCWVFATNTPVFLVLLFFTHKKHPVGASIHRRKESFPVKPSLTPSSPTCGYKCQNLRKLKPP